MRPLILISVALLAVSACSEVRVVNTEEPVTVAPTPTGQTPPVPPVDKAHTVDPSEYAAQQNGQTAYYFSTPSGRWQCAIIPRVKAGCQATGATLDIFGAPETVPDASGAPTAPNAVVIEPTGDPLFVALDQPEFALASGSANVLPFNTTLNVIAAGFRCNIQEELGVGCMSEQSGKGFTFSADGYQPHYTEVPADAPLPPG